MSGRRDAVLDGRTRRSKRRWRCAAGLASVAGVALGNLGSAIGTSLGLAAVLAVSSTAFLVVKYAGAAYLIYLGFRMLRRGPDDGTPRLRSCVRGVFADGFVVALLNPKTALFFAAFLPQFLSPGASPVQSIALGAAFVAIAAATDSLYALGAAGIAPYLQRGDGMLARGRCLAAGVLFGLGLLTALTGPRSVSRP